MVTGQRQAAAAEREVTVITQVAAQATRIPGWLAGAWLATLVAAMTAIAAGTAVRSFAHGAGSVSAALSFTGIGLFALWVACPVVVWLQARRRGVFPRRDPLLPVVSGASASRRRLAGGSALIGLSAAGAGYWMAVTDSHGTRYGGLWALAGSVLLGAAAVALVGWPSRGPSR
jgi:hypothetical protein